MDTKDQDFTVLSGVEAHAPHALWSDIAAVADLPRDDVTASLDRLEEQGLVAFRRHITA